MQNISLYTELFYAIKGQDEDVQSRICDRLRQATHARGDEEAIDLMMEAAEAPDLTVLAFLLDKLSADCLRMKNSQGGTIVHQAAEMQAEEAPEALELMVEKLGIDCLRLKGFKGRKAVHCAAWNGAGAYALSWLVDRLEPFEFYEDADADNYSALQYAFCAQSLSAQQQLAQRNGGVCLKIKGPQGKTVFHVAALNSENPETLHWLIETQGPDAFLTPDCDRTTAMHFAFANQTGETVQKLIEKLGTECLKLQTSMKRTAVHCAALNQNSPSALIWLMEVVESKEFITQDANDDTAVHLAFWKQNAEVAKLIVQKLGTSCLHIAGKDRQTAVHNAALNDKSSGAILWLIDILEPEALLNADFNGDSALHLCFWKQNSDVVSSLINKVGEDCLRLPGKDGQTAAHNAALNENCQTALLWLIETQDLGIFLTYDDNNATALHIALRRQGIEVVQRLVQKIGPEALNLRGYRGLTTLQYAARNEKSPVVFDLVCQSLAETDRSVILHSLDEFGRSSLHLCAINRKFSAMLFEKVSKMLNFENINEAINQSLDKDGRNPLFAACSAKNFEFLKLDSLRLNEHRGTDSDGNTLFHAFFKIVDPRMYFSTNVDELLEAARLLIQEGFDPGAENAMKRNCLQELEIDEDSLNEILTHIAHSDLKPTFSKLQQNSEGLHAIHVFSSRYNIQHLESSLSQLFDLSNEQLLSIRVSGGPMKGATCLHFACEAGHKVNISYLLGKGLNMLAQTVSGQTCVDFACNKGKLSAFLELAESAGIELSGVLKLVDPARRALQLPDRQSARTQLAQFTDPALRPNIERDRSSQQAMLATRSQSTGESAEVRMLCRALELDSSEMLRSLITLDTVLDEIDDEIIIHFATLKGEHSHDPRSFKSLYKFKAFSKEVRDSLALTECALLFGKPNLLSDLMLLPQFEIIPETVRLLIHLRARPMVEVLSNEQLNRVSKQAQSVIINALEQMFINADSSEKELLFKYLNGSFLDQDGIAGPKFLGPFEALANLDEACAETDKGSDRDCEEETQVDIIDPKYSKVKSPCDPIHTKFVSVMKLVDILDCDDLFATDCISELVERQWQETPVHLWRQCPTGQCGSKIWRPTVSQRFIIYSVSYAVFLAFFSWYVIDFGKAQKHPIAFLTMALYALSLSLQELNKLVNKCSITDVYVRERRFRLPRYFTDICGFFDFSGLLLLWLGLLLKLFGGLNRPGVLRSSQVILTVSFLFVGYRLVALLSYFKVTGPKISILKSLLLKDLAPFLLILLAFVYTFGVFYFSLLFPAFSDSRNFGSLKLLFTMPMSLAFGKFENAEFPVCNSSAQASGPECADPDAYAVYSNVLMFVYLVIVNIVMWNLLIALFSRTVTEMASKAEVLWRKDQFKLLQEFAEVIPVPPPFSFPFYACILMSKCAVTAKSRESRDEKVFSATRKAGQTQRPWWRNRKSFAGYPEDFKRFLTYQAEQLRQHRPRLRHAIERHRGDTEALMAHTENRIEDLRDDVTQAVARLINGSLETGVKTEIEQMEAKLNENQIRNQDFEKSMEQRLKSLEYQMAELLSLVRAGRADSSGGTMKRLTESDV